MRAMMMMLMVMTIMLQRKSKVPHYTTTAFAQSLYGTFSDFYTRGHTQYCVLKEHALRKKSTVIRSFCCCCYWLLLSVAKSSVCACWAVVLFSVLMDRNLIDFKTVKACTHSLAQYQSICHLRTEPARHWTRRACSACSCFCSDTHIFRSCLIIDLYLLFHISIRWLWLCRLKPVYQYIMLGLYMFFVFFYLFSFCL